MSEVRQVILTISLGLIVGELFGIAMTLNHIANILEKHWGIS